MHVPSYWLVLLSYYFSVKHSTVLAVDSALVSWKYELLVSVESYSKGSVDGSPTRTSSVLRLGLTLCLQYHLPAGENAKPRGGARRSGDDESEFQGSHLSLSSLRNGQVPQPFWFTMHLSVNLGTLLPTPWGYPKEQGSGESAWNITKCSVNSAKAALFLTKLQNWLAMFCFQFCWLIYNF